VKLGEYHGCLSGNGLCPRIARFAQDYSRVRELGKIAQFNVGNLEQLPMQRVCVVPKLWRSIMGSTRADQTRSIFITGLKNAHAMENQALSIMRPQLERIENYPSVAAKLRDHIAETEGQEKRLEDLLAEVDSSASGFKDTVLSLGGTLAAIGHSVAGDEIIKNSLANFAFENYEIAAYNSLLTMAEAAGFHEAKSILTSNLNEEKAMAQWLEDNLRDVTLQFVGLREAGETAKI